MDALQQLRDLHLPAAPGWWPPAPGWWLIALILLGALVGLGWAWARRRARRRPFRAARHELDQLSAARRRGALNTAELVQGCSALLRRLFIHALAQQQAAALTDSRWPALLDAYLDDPGQQRVLHSAFGDDRFRRDFETDTEALIPVTRTLIRRLEAAA